MKIERNDRQRKMIGRNCQICLRESKNLEYSSIS